MRRLQLTALSLLTLLTACHDSDLLSPSLFTVGGTVSGLPAPMTLELNGVEQITVTEDGPFLFTTTLGDGDAYDVTVVSSPPGWEYEMDSTSGTIASANVGLVTVRFTWKHPADLADAFSPATGDAHTPRAGFDDDGNALVAWLQSDGTNDQVYVSELQAGTWTHPADSSDHLSVPGTSVRDVALAVDADGDAIVAWIQWNGLHDQVFLAQRDGGVWTTPSGLNDNVSPDGSNAYSPSVAFDGLGDALVAWQQSNGANQQVFLSEYRLGVWTHPADLTDHVSLTGGEATDPFVAADATGDALLVWSQAETTDYVYRIRLSEYRSGTWTHPTGFGDFVGPAGTGSARSPHAAFAGNGDAILTWRQSDGTAYNVYLSEWTAGTWTHPADLADHVSLAGFGSFDPYVALDGAGNAVLSWYQEDGTDVARPFFSERRAGTWTHPTGFGDSLSPDGVNAGILRTGFDDAGEAVMTWVQIPDLVALDFEVVKSERRGGTWSHTTAPLTALNPLNGQIDVEESPLVAVAPNGDALVLWVGIDGGGTTRVYLSQLD